MTEFKEDKVVNLKEAGLPASLLDGTITLTLKRDELSDEELTELEAKARELASPYPIKVAQQ
jgi:hypothetical protein